MVPPIEKKYNCFSRVLLFFFFGMTITKIEINYIKTHFRFIIYINI